METKHKLYRQGNVERSLEYELRVDHHPSDTSPSPNFTIRVMTEMMRQRVRVV